VVEVVDQGEGVPEPLRGKVFDLFFTAHHGVSDGRRGLGLGLSLCKSIISAHGGEIFVRENQPKGSIFGFTLKLEEVETHEECHHPGCGG
jgi:two-component system sensor histidine kinase KdpD